MSEPGVPASPEASQEPTIGQLVADASRDLSTVVRTEIALAKSEVKVSAKSGAVGAGFLAAVAVLMLFVITMLSMAGGFFLAWVFDHDVSIAFTWGFLIMTGIWLLVVVICALIGIRMVKKVRAPERTIATVKEIPGALKGQGQPAATPSTD
ncbi:putative superfamily III holin-X [Mumia flava]|uniref:Putative superfamily III holin-X n=1 Tax=Mumia flava TaxID=1348852 RepID=A0A0B2BJU6_9ACTN|nr:phage holin family protein [Mumia flava]PJJ57388.1 putative superfamily III holin-X [Mumia flava]